jgi:arylsulfatase A-like enzyme
MVWNMQVNQRAFLGALRRLAAIGVLLLVAAGASSRAASTAPRPNILVILTDDHGIGDVSAYRPNGDVRTPHLDRLAAEGLRFASMRANATVCSPTRAALLTGRYPDRVGVPGVIRTDPANSWGWFAPGVPTLADHLRSAGYRTAIVGKWHLGLESPNTPNERGFDFFHGFLGDMMDNYVTHRRHGQNYMRRNAEVIEPTGHATDLFTDWACDYLRSAAGSSQPFFLYLAYNAPHFPIEPPAEWLARVRADRPGLDPKRAANVAFVEHLDDAIGRVMATLREAGLEKDTLVVFTSDNGGALAYAQSNEPWRDGKQSHYDGGLRVPFFARWPDRIPAGTTTGYAGLTFDIFATALDVAGVPPPADLDAVSLRPLFEGVPATAMPARELYFVRREGGVRYGGLAYEALVHGEWKLLRNDPFAPYELYRVSEDPGETRNVIADHPAVARDLRQRLMNQIQRGGTAPWQPPGAP